MRKAGGDAAGAGAGRCQQHRPATSGLAQHGSEQLSTFYQEQAPRGQAGPPRAHTLPVAISWSFSPCTLSQAAPK
jgi:hypothetical protein